MADLTIFALLESGCDASHRARNQDTHPTHGCIAQFRQVSRLRKGCANLLGKTNATISLIFEGAPRALKEAAA